MLSGTSTKLGHLAHSGKFHLYALAKGDVPRSRTRIKPFATAKPRGGRRKVEVSPTAKASPKKKLPQESSSVSKANINVKSQTSDAKGQVDSAAASAKQGVSNIAYNAKEAVDNIAPRSAGARKNINEQEDSIADGIDAGADALKDAVGSSTTSRRDAQRAIDEQADSVKDGLDAGTDALKDVISDGSVQAQRAADDFQRQANVAADRVEDNIQAASRNVQAGIDEASVRLDEAIDQAPEQVAGAVQQAVDTTAAGIREARAQLEELQKPGPKAPFQSTPLTSLDSAPFESRPGPKPALDKQSEYFKKRVLYCVSGLDRGFSANKSAVAEVEATVSSLLSVTKPVVLSWAPEEGQESSTLADLNGTWRLIYSSAFATGNAPSLPGYKLGQVYQGISAYASRLDNIVEFYSTLSLPQLPGLPAIEPIVTTATLKHYFESLGGSTVQIAFEDTELKSTGGPNGILGRLPEVSLPQLPEGLRPSRASRSSTFEILFMDDELRITRGKLGELRIFLRT